MYCPPFRDMSKKFSTDVLSGKKKLLPMKSIIRVMNPPKFKGKNIIYLNIIVENPSTLESSYFNNFKKLKNKEKQTPQQKWRTIRNK